MATGPRLLNNLQCTGSEPRLVDCMSDGLGMPTTCTGQAAALVCQESKQIATRAWHGVTYILSVCINYRNSGSFKDP